MTIQLFNNQDFGQIRVIEKDGEPWFVAKDICDALDLTNPTMALQHLDDDERYKFNLGRQGMTNTVNEYGLYSLVLSSRKPEAKAFKRWITHEVLPSIKKHGGYLTPEKIEDVLSDPDTLIRLATDLKAERAERQRLASENATLAPKALFADAVSASSSSILVGELAKILRQNGIKDMGQNRLFSQLRERGYLMKQGSAYNMPTQRSMELGLFEIKETSITHSDGHTTVSKTPKVTGKGQLYFVNLFITEAA